jgi:hypothetical protein
MKDGSWELTPPWPYMCGTYCQIRTASDGTAVSSAANNATSRQSSITGRTM